MKQWTNVYKVRMFWDLVAEVKRLREEVEQWESLARAYAKILKSTNLPLELIE
jgi:hypothetical protein